MNTDTTIYAVDEMVARPGRGRELLDAYRTRYAPGAEARGLTLDRILVSPPMWLDDETNSNTLLVTWTLKGAPNWWATSFQSRNDPGVADWWAEADEMVVSRNHYFATADGDIAEITNV